MNRVAEVFRVFLKLGLMSFGGPVAHLGFFRAECVQRRGWLTDAAYADIVALCQFLPGPASSQVGFALGYLRAGLPGAFAAWTAFTLPSAAIMIACASGVGALKAGSGWLHGLEIAAFAVVAQAVWQMGRRLCPDAPRLVLAGAAALLALGFPTAGMQVALIAAGLLVGRAAFRAGREPAPEGPASRASPWSVPCLVAFFVLLGALPLLAAATHDRGIKLAADFYRAGAMVFGGGHVVLPLLETATVGTGMVTRGDFLAGYGVAQAVPGPLFTFAAYLGALAGPGWLAGAGCMVAILLPSFLLVLGVLPHWEKLRALPGARGALAGANSVVVGLLLAALCHPVGTTALTSVPSVLLALAALLGLQAGKSPPWLLVGACALAGGIFLS